MRFLKVRDGTYEVTGGEVPVGIVKRVVKNLWWAQSNDGRIREWDDTRKGAGRKLIERMGAE